MVRFGQGARHWRAGQIKLESHWLVMTVFLLFFLSKYLDNNSVGLIHGQENNGVTNYGQDVCQSLGRPNKLRVYSVNSKSQRTQHFKCLFGPLEIYSRKVEELTWQRQIILFRLQTIPNKRSFLIEKSNKIESSLGDKSPLQYYPAKNETENDSGMKIRKVFRQVFIAIFVILLSRFHKHSMQIERYLVNIYFQK